MDFSNNYSERSALNNIKSHLTFSREVSLETITWLNDTPGVFDYEDNNITSNRFTLKCSSEDYSIIKTKSSFIVLHTDKVDSYLNEHPNALNIFDISMKDGSIVLIPKIVEPTSDENLWLMVKPNQIETFISAGDVIKLGRVKLLVKEAIVNPSCSNIDINKQFYDFLQKSDQEFNDSDGSNSPLILPNNNDTTNYNQDCLKRASEVHTLYDYDHNTKLSVIDSNSNDKTMACGHEFQVYQKENTTSTPYCRICLCDDDEHDNPLISPCNCRGSMESIHLHCLRTWMNGRLEVRSKANEVISFFLRELTCELCKGKYPHMIEKFSKQYQLMDIVAPKAPFMILQSLNDKSGFYVVSFSSKKSLTVGRSMEADLKISDISVSRIHASIKFNKSGFSIDDHNSKFGTLYCLQKPIKLNNFRSKLQFKFGNSLVNIRLRKNINWLFFNRFHQNQLQNDILTAISPVPSLFIKRPREMLGTSHYQFNRSNEREAISIN